MSKWPATSRFDKCSVFVAPAVFRELYCRVTNPARALMFWDADVRGSGALFAKFRQRMMQLLQEVCVLSCQFMLLLWSLLGRIRRLSCGQR